MTGLAGVVMSGVVRLGPLRVSSYGLCAAVGLVAALRLSLRTAKTVGMEPAELWDAGLVGLTAGFGVSRVLLVVRDWHAFVQYPMLVLALPSFTYLGMGITAALIGGYLWRRRLPVLRVMDAWAPCAALLAVALEVGHWREGSEAGMPWRGRLVPVQAMGAVGAAMLGLALLWMLRQGRAPGSVARLGLMVGGLMAFGLDMVSQPVVSGAAWLEPGQWVAVGAMVGGGVLLAGGVSVFEGKGRPRRLR